MKIAVRGTLARKVSTVGGLFAFAILGAIFLRPKRTSADAIGGRDSPIDAVDEAMLEIYQQAAHDSRAYMDMRNRHFSTFLVITGILLVGFFEIGDLAPRRALISVLGLVFTVLYWLLDYRMAQYLRGSSRIVQFYERRFGKPAFQMTPGPRLLPATVISNFLFLLLLALWLGLILFPHALLLIGSK